MWYDIYLAFCVPGIVYAVYLLAGRVRFPGVRLALAGLVANTVVCISYFVSREAIVLVVTQPMTERSFLRTLEVLFWTKAVLSVGFGLVAVWISQGRFKQLLAPGYWTREC